MIRCYPIQLPVFEGPLDLLLQLIEREELDITAVSLAQVTDQYLAIVEEMGRRNSLGDLTAFLVVAAKLVLIKSRVLLPGYRPRSGEEDEVAADLIRQLETYRAYRAIAAELARLEERGWRAYVRVAPPGEARSGAADPSTVLYGVTLEDLLRAAQEALRAHPAPAVETVIAPPLITVAEQIQRIQEQLARAGRICFQDLLLECTGRAEVVITLLAVLELIKQAHIRVQQEGVFGPIFICPYLQEQPPLAPNLPDGQIW